MSNGINGPQGLQIVQSAIGNGGTQKLGTYKIYADPTGQITYGKNLYAGDPVMFANIQNAPINGAAGYIMDSATYKANPVANTISGNLGVFVGCTYINAQGQLQEVDYWLAGTQVMEGTQITAYVNDDPMAIFNIQVSTSTNTLTDANFLNSWVGQNANLAVAGGGNNLIPPNLPTGNTYSGSVYYLDGSTVATGMATHSTDGINYDVKIIGLAPSTSLTPVLKVPLVPGIDQPFLNVLVKWNNHVYGSSGIQGAPIA